MAKYTKGIITLQTIVDEVMNDLNETSRYDFKRYLQWAIRGFNKLNMLHLNTVETYVSRVSSINTIDLPDDYIDYYRIGYVYDSYIYEITRNDDITMVMTESCGEEVADTNLTDAMPIVNLTWIGAPNRTFDVGEFRYDRANNRLILKGQYTDVDIVVEYKSSGVRLDGRTYIPLIAKETLIAFVHWQRTEFDGESDVKVLRAKQRFQEEFDDMINLEWAMTPNEFLMAINSGMSQTI
jgi:hypothetical protein